MTNTTERYVDTGSYGRWQASHEKKLSRWRDSGIAGAMSISLGTVTAGAALIGVPALDMDSRGIIALTGIGLLMLGLCLWATGKYMIHRHRLDNVEHRIAVHFMQEMGIPKPHSVLIQNPSYLDSFDQVRRAVTAKEIPCGSPYELPDITPLSQRIGSLVLRDEQLLALTPYLLTLIEDRGLIDYDSLAAMLDSKKEHHTTLTAGLL